MLIISPEAATGRVHLGLLTGGPKDRTARVAREESRLCCEECAIIPVNIKQQRDCLVFVVPIE